VFACTGQKLKVVAHHLSYVSAPRELYHIHVEETGGVLEALVFDAKES